MLADSGPVEGAPGAPVRTTAAPGRTGRGHGFHELVHHPAARQVRRHAARHTPEPAPQHVPGHEIEHRRASGAGAASAPVTAALKQAMTAEAVPDSWESGLNYLMMQESGGRVGVRNPASSARGLFQLTASNYHLNPHGVHSFGHAAEEAQGGIRYIKERYGTVDNAVAHWRYKHTY